MLEDKVFIEEQFPVSLVSKESYKERKANLGQTLTGLGKWWGRKPLILIRASVIGMLMPASHDPHKDREIFLKILTMDDDGIWDRRSKSISAQTIYAWLIEHGRAQEARDLFKVNSAAKASWDRKVSAVKRDSIVRQYFDELNYDQKLVLCDRPEHIAGPSTAAWEAINAHLGTDATNLKELIDQLGQLRFGRIPRVGDAFCGGGSIPFEAARIGCDTYASDLNPVATLLTWSALNLIGGGKSVQNEVHEAQKDAFEAANKRIIEWGIEHNAAGWRADAFLYCVEAICPSTGYLLPLAPSWVVSEKYKACAVLIPDHANKRYHIEIVMNADKETFKKAKEGTVQKGRMVCPETGETFAISDIRGDRRINGETVYGLRMWEEDDLVPRTDDTFQERLYCVRWAEPYWAKNAKGEDVLKYHRHYLSVTDEDVLREQKVLSLLTQKVEDWKIKGFLPSRPIERGGDKTEEPIRTRGWTYWHHLFNPRQLLEHGLLSSLLSESMPIAASLGLGRLANWNSKLCQWLSDAANEKGSHTFQNQALNTLYTYSVRPFEKLSTAWYIFSNLKDITTSSSEISVTDARNIETQCDLWITDPPYADAVNYHELSDYFLAWYDKNIIRAFPGWYTNTKKALAVKGSGQDFKRSMVEVYKRLAYQMPDNGLQMVQFTHQDPSVWADLGMILWAAGLQVTAAWTIATETDSALKKGNYVQGTVLLILRKRLNDLDAFTDELPPEIEDAVKDQLDHMTAIDDQDHPNFGDTDYQLAAYAAALRVLTQYSEIEGINIENELYREKQKGQKSEFEKLIDQAVEIACNHLVPGGFDEFQWKSLTADERLYLKGLELEKHGELRAGAYQELAKGFGVREYNFMYAKTKANEVRFKTAREFGRSHLKEHGFDASIVRHALFAIHETIKQESAQQGVNYLKTEVPTFWNDRKKLIEVLRYLSRLAHIDHMEHWETDAEAASTLAGALENTNG